VRSLLRLFDRPREGAAAGPAEGLPRVTLTAGSSAESAPTSGLLTIE